MIASQMKWCSTSMCFMHVLVSVVLVASAMALWLSHQMVVGWLGLKPRSISKFHIQIASCVACVELMYLALVDESAGDVCALLLHESAAPAIINTYPLMDFQESISLAQSVSLKP